MPNPPLTPYSPSFTQANLTALEQAIVSGAHDVYYGDKRVTYRNLGEMFQIRALMMAALGMTDNRQQYKQAVSDKGLISHNPLLPDVDWIGWPDPYFD